MSQKALSMRKIKEVLRLRYDLGLLARSWPRRRIDHMLAAMPSGLGRTGYGP
jgi:hypothetical protein